MITPFDTGKRAEPKVWSPDGDEDRYGKVDFDDDEGATIVTVWVERDPTVGYVVHVYDHGTWRIAVDTETPS